MTEETQQSTFRVARDLLRLARYYLNEERKSINEFIVEQLESYVRRRTEDSQPSEPDDSS